MTTPPRPPAPYDKDLQRLLGPTRTGETIIAMVTISEVAAPFAAAICWLRGGAGLYLLYLLTLIIAWVAFLSGFIFYPPPRRLSQVRWPAVALALAYLCCAGGMPADTSLLKLAFLVITNYVVSVSAISSSSERAKEQLHADIFARFPAGSPEIPAVIDALTALSNPDPASTVDVPSVEVLTTLIDALKEREAAPALPPRT